MARGAPGGNEDPKKPFTNALFYCLYEQWRVNSGTARKEMHRRRYVGRGTELPRLLPAPSHLATGKLQYLYFFKEPIKLKYEINF